VASVSVETALALAAETVTRVHATGACWLVTVPEMVTDAASADSASVSPVPLADAASWQPAAVAITTIIIAVADKIPDRHRLRVSMVRPDPSRAGFPADTGRSVLSHPTARFLPRRDEQPRAETSGEDRVAIDR
jgi:hypothetical protein